MISEHLTILDGETEIVRLWGNGAKSSGNEDHIFSELTGWRDQSIEISTVPKLFGQGSYLTERARPSRELSLTVWVKQESRLGLHTAFLTALRQFRTLTWRLVSTDSSNEEINVVLTSVGEPMRYSDGTTTFTIEGIALDPDPESISDLPTFSFVEEQVEVEVGTTATINYEMINGENTERVDLAEINSREEELGLAPVEDSNAFLVAPSVDGTYEVEVTHFREDDFRMATGSYTIIAFLGMPQAPTAEFLRQEAGYRVVFRFGEVYKADEYEVEYQIGEQEWEPVNMSATPNEDIVVEAGAPEVSVGFRVRVHRQGYTSEWRTVQTTTFGAPEAPEITVLEQDYYEILVRYEGMENVDSYSVEYRFGSEAFAPLPDAQPDTDLSIPTLIGATEFEIRAKAANVEGESPWRTESLTLLPMTDPPLIDAPVLERVEQFEASVQVEYSVVPGAEAYKLSYRFNDDPFTTLPGTAPLTTAEITIPTYATSFTVRVRASNSEGASAWNEETIPVYVDPNALDAPVVDFLRQEAGYRAVFSFSPVDGAIDYSAQVNINGAGWTTHSASTPNEEITITASAWQTVSFRVMAHSGVGQSGWGSASATLFGVPSAPVFDNVESDGVEVSVRYAASAGADEYELEYDFDGSGWTPVASQPGVDVVIPIPQGAVEFSTRVRAGNVEGFSLWRSQTLTVGEEEEPPTPLDAPTVSFISQSGNEIYFVFAAVSNATGYVVEYNANGGAWIAHSTPTTAGAITIEGIAGDLITVRVKATNDDTESEWGTASYTIAAPPDAPTITSILLDGNVVRVIYDSVANADEYHAEYQFDTDGWVGIATQPEVEFDITVPEWGAQVLTVRVRAHSFAAGSSAWTEESISVDSGGGASLATPDVYFHGAGEGTDGTAAFFSFDEVENATSYSVVYSINYGAQTPISPTPLPYETIEVAAAPGDFVELQVQASDGTNVSEWGYASGYVEDTNAPEDPPEDPEILTLEEIEGEDAILVVYSAAARAEWYYFEYGFLFPNSDDDEYAYLGDTEPNTDIVIPIPPGAITFTLTLAAENSYGYSNWIYEEIDLGD